MRILKAFLRFLISRRLWIFLGVALLCALIWLFGQLVSIGTIQPFADDLSKLIAIGVILVLWLLSVLIGQLRAARANQVFVTELARAEPERPQGRPGDGAVAEINTKFQSILGEMKRSKLGRGKFLREMPWYIFIGPPGTGKTTALKQSGLHFPIDLSDDIKGVGGTRNCDWFFTDDAVLVDTAGRYTEQASAPEIDAAEWAGFLDLLRKHRGRRALNGVIVAISVRELLGPEAELRNHGREIRKRLGELRERLAMQLPVYLMVTKADLIPGFEAFFADLSEEDREQVWGATFATDARVDGVAVEREMAALAERAETRLAARLGTDVDLTVRAEMFRFPAQFLRLEAPLKLLIDAVFGETRYDDASWLRGFYFSSATQEGSPIDRLVGELAGAFGIMAEPPQARRFGQKRSYFLREFLTDLVFPEAGLGLFDQAAEDRRKWIWRGTLATASLAVVLASTAFVYSYSRYTGAIAEQGRQLTALRARLSDVASRQAPTDALDLDVALAAMAEIEGAETEVPQNALTVAGPTARAEMAQAQRIAYERGLKNILEPRMLALLEATMLRQIRDPEFLLGALKTYNMMTGKAPYDREFVALWWENELPRGAPIEPFPTDAALTHQIAAIARLADDEEKFEGDPVLAAEALDSVCEIPLAIRAYSALMTQSEVTALPEWTPSEAVTATGAQVLARLSGKTLRVGLPGAFTYRGFHDVILPAIPGAAAQAALDSAIFAGGCREGTGSDAAALEAEILSQYEKDFMDQWDGFLRDIRLAPITDLRVATANLKDLATDDSALTRLLNAVVKETDLTRVEEEGGGEVPPGLLAAAAKRLGSAGRLVKAGARLGAGAGGDAATGPVPGAAVAEHFAPLKGVVAEVDGNPPLITDVIAALGALSAEMQTVSASPDPEAALLARGGLPQLTGAIAQVAQGLPDPIDDWVAGIAGDTISVTREAVLAQLNARWRADVLPFCRSATSGRYPFDEASPIDVNVVDFNRLFGPGQLIDGFVNTHLLPYVDTTVRPWQWRADFGLPAQTLQPFERARAIRDGLFPGGAGPVMSFTLEPKDLSPNASRVTLNVDGQSLVYFNSAVRPMPMTWPGPDRTRQVSLSFAPLDGSAEPVATETGDWAFLRMIRKARMRQGALPEVFSLTLGLSGFSAEFELRAASVDNPFDLTMFGGFSCPDGF